MPSQVLLSPVAPDSSTILARPLAGNVGRLLGVSPQKDSFPAIACAVASLHESTQCSPFSEPPRCLLLLGTWYGYENVPDRITRPTYFMRTSHVGSHGLARFTVQEPLGQALRTRLRGEGMAACCSHR
jgi:hypothetical protein